MHERIILFLPLYICISRTIGVLLTRGGGRILRRVNPIAVYSFLLFVSFLGTATVRVR